MRHYILWLSLLVLAGCAADQTSSQKNESSNSSEQAGEAVMGGRIVEVGHRPEFVGYIVDRADHHDLIAVRLLHKFGHYTDLS